jgi:hypothetical protein
VSPRRRGVAAEGPVFGPALLLSASLRQWTMPTAGVIASALLRYRDEAGDELADIIDLLTMHPDARRKVVRMLAEIDAAG